MSRSISNSWETLENASSIPTNSHTGSDIYAKKKYIIPMNKELKKKRPSIKIIRKYVGLLRTQHPDLYKKWMKSHTDKEAQKFEYVLLRKTMYAHGKRTKRRKSKRTKKRISKATRKR
jgi:hypothetical protein